ncbi:MAG: hypothetical protein AAGC44_09190 [Planctomycetota bacterium]
MPLGLIRISVVGLGLAVGQATASPFISEVFFSGVGGPSIEVSNIVPGIGATLVIADAKRFDTNAFGNVLDVFYLTPNNPSTGADLFSTAAWPDPVPHRTLDQVNHQSNSNQWSLGNSAFDRLLLLYEGTSPLQQADNPIQSQLSQDRHDDKPLADYLLIGPGDMTNAYTPGFISQADAALGTDLLARAADRNAGPVLARTFTPGQEIDLTTVYQGEPDAFGIIPISASQQYLTTPGQTNLPLVNVPEPGGAGVIGLFFTLGLRHRRRTA